MQGPAAVRWARSISRDKQALARIVRSDRTIGEKLEDVQVALAEGIAALVLEQLQITQDHHREARVAVLIAMQAHAAQQAATVAQAREVVAAAQIVQAAGGGRCRDGRPEHGSRPVAVEQRARGAVGRF